MNIDRSLVARAFAKAGEEPITETEWNDNESNRVRVVKEFYLAVILDALASYDWTSQKKRAQLELVDPEWEENLTTWTFMYMLPADCAKCVSVNDGQDYVVEGAYIYSNEENATLLYITNHFTGKYVFKEVENPVADDITSYYVLNTDGGYEKAETFSDEETYYIIDQQDYNFYGDIKFDAPLESFIESKLAANIALKLTGDKEKYQMLFNEASIVGNNAQKKSAEMARNRSKGNPTWISQLGLK